MTSSSNFDEPSTANDNVDNNSINLNSLYNSHLWKNSKLRKDIINAPSRDSNISYCYTCKGKIRKYEVKCQNNFTPHKHSTPNKDFQIDESMVDIQLEQPDKNLRRTVSSSDNVSNNTEPVNTGIKQYIPSISQQIDSSFRQKYTAYENEPCDIGRHRLNKNLRGFGCLVNFTSTHSPFKKSTQIQACSISIMVVAIVIISFILVNFTNAHFKSASNNTSTTVVPITNLDVNETPSSITNIYSNLQTITDNYVEKEAEDEMIESINNNNTETTSISVISKIRKNIRTYPKEAAIKVNKSEPRDSNMLSEHFCSCQSNEICMLDENSGTAICKKPVDANDPTGCGGLCALEIEACHLVDKTSGVRVCRLLTVTCSPHEWRCRNGLCVPMESRCNGSIQCYDRSDEMNCDCDLNKQFQCGHSISCFPKTKLCDGVIDCWDGFDEVNCTTECPKNQFTCTNGQCILSSRFCDGLADCDDGSDEPDGCGGNCGANEIPCKNHRCVPRTVLCDGHDNCGDATDELNCSNTPKR